jgi:hypothetical protein
VSRTKAASIAGGVYRGHVRIGAWERSFRPS